MYPEEIVKPMKLELTSNGFQEISNDDDVKKLIENGTAIIMINSVCGLLPLMPDQVLFHH